MKSLSLLLLCLAVFAVSPSQPRFVSRSEWRATRPRRITRFRRTPNMVVVHHTATGSCSHRRACNALVKRIQKDHKAKPWDDIGYNFLVAPSGDVYEGRGWDNVGAHAGTRADNRRSIGIAFIGNFENQDVTNAAWIAYRRLVNDGKSSRKIALASVVKGHKDLKSTDCPGRVLYQWLSTATILFQP